VGIDCLFNGYLEAIRDRFDAAQAGGSGGPVAGRFGSAFLFPNSTLIIDRALRPGTD
jgi:hypothetical protein